RNRSVNSRDPPGRNFIATRRPSRVSRARYTRPMAPRPSSRMSSYCRTRVPAATMDSPAIPRNDEPRIRIAPHRVKRHAVRPLASSRRRAMRLIYMLGLLSACASSAAPVRSLPIPAPLEVPAGQALVLEARARGVQVYQCRPTSDPGKFEWTLTGPEAELFDVAGKPIGMHSAGPAWQV